MADPFGIVTNSWFVEAFRKVVETLLKLVITIFISLLLVALGVLAVLISGIDIGNHWNITYRLRICALNSRNLLFLSQKSIVQLISIDH